MKNILSLSIVLMLSLPAMASGQDCIGRLTHRFTLDGQSFTINLDEARIRDFGRDHTAQAISVVRAVLDKVGCGQAAVNFGQSSLGRSKHACHQLVAGRELSQTCYIETNLGAFVVTYDYLNNAYIVFKRWD